MRTKALSPVEGTGSETRAGFVRVESESAEDRERVDRDAGSGARMGKVEPSAPAPSQGIGAVGIPVGSILCPSVRISSRVVKKSSGLISGRSREDRPFPCLRTCLCFARFPGPPRHLAPVSRPRPPPWTCKVGETPGEKTDPTTRAFPLGIHMRSRHTGHVPTDRSRPNPRNVSPITRRHGVEIFQHSVQMPPKIQAAMLATSSWRSPGGDPRRRSGQAGGLKARNGSGTLGA